MAQVVACIEIGNQNVKCGLFSGDRLQKIITAKNESILDISALISSHIRKVIICRTNPFVEVKYSNISVVEVNHSLPLPVINLYQPQESLGLDRLIAACAAWIETRRGVAVISAGTCITLTVVSKKGEIIGGYISPGVTTRLQSMHRAAPALPQLTGAHTSWQWNGKWITPSTAEGMLTGAIAGVVSELNAALRWCAENVGIEIGILCGGDASLLYSYLSTTSNLSEIQLREWFILEALYTVCKHVGIL